MPSPYRDATREGGWVPWLERLAPLVVPKPPMEWTDFVMGTRGSARTLACQLRQGMIPIPDGRWDFRVRVGTVRVMYLGPLTGS